MNREDCRKIWNRYIEAAEETGKKPNSEEQENFSLFTAFYWANSSYDDAKNSLIEAFFRDNDRELVFANNEEEINGMLLL